MTTAFTRTDGQTVHLGRIKPRAIIEAGDFVLVVRQDGSHRAVPKLAPHYDQRRMAMLPPDRVDWGARAANTIAQMYGNDQQGDCVIASAMHQVGLWTANDSDSGGEAIGTTQEALSQYHQFCGAGDNGCDISSVSDIIKSRGLTVGGKKYTIDGYVSVNNLDRDLVKTAIVVFGSIKLGIDLPSAWANSNDGDRWDVTNTGIVGGHDVSADGYDEVGVEIMTWAGKRRITWPAFLSKRWITEAYVILARAWYNSDSLAPNGINATTLLAYLNMIGGGTTPPIPDPTPVPPVPPTPTPSNYLHVIAPIAPGAHRIGDAQLYNASQILPGDYPVMDQPDGGWIT